jgi:predicted nucleic acid-binding protein
MQRRNILSSATIAAIAEANDCVVVTDNEKDFEGVEIINPLRVTE